MDESKIDAKTIENHGLTQEEFERANALVGRPINIVELGLVSAMFSEHCSYKSSKAHLAKFPTCRPTGYSGAGRKRGSGRYRRRLRRGFKMESHNHPSYIEPYQGAATGVGGILRDIFTMGARPVANLNSLRSAPLTIPKPVFW